MAKFCKANKAQPIELTDAQAKVLHRRAACSEARIGIGVVWHDHLVFGLQECYDVDQLLDRHHFVVLVQLHFGPSAGQHGIRLVLVVASYLMRGVDDGGDEFSVRLKRSYTAAEFYMRRSDFFAAHPFYIANTVAVVAVQPHKKLFAGLYIALRQDKASGLGLTGGDESQAE